mmetsp:Transcript_18218/g.54804  ORF Transcript_18218/g.54804 Transcript_18218/m.54804 type:complete len:256 (+) Transcript_18218:4209-4976(+)
MLWVFNNRHNSSSSSSKRQPRLVVTMPITQHLLPPVALPQLPPLNHFSNRHSLPSSCSYRRCRRRHSTLPFPARARFLSTTWVHWPGLRHSCQGSHHRLGSCRGRTHHQLGSPHLTLARHPHRRLHYPRDGVGEGQKACRLPGTASLQTGACCPTGSRWCRTRAPQPLRRAQGRHLTFVATRPVMVHTQRCGGGRVAMGRRLRPTTRKDAGRPGCSRRCVRWGGTGREACLTPRRTPCFPLMPLLRSVCAGNWRR